MKLVFNTIFLLISSNTFCQSSSIHESLFFLTTKDCYDCVDCRSATSTNTIKGDLKREEKYMRLFCDGESTGVVTLYRITECLQEKYSLEFIKGVFRTESEAKSQLKIFADELCAKNEMIVDGKIVNREEYRKNVAEADRLKREKEDRERKERAQLLSDLNSGKITADTIDWTNPVTASTLDKDAILSAEWKIFNKRDYSPQKLSFSEDGSFKMFDSNAPSGEKDETGPYFINPDNSITLYRAPIINLYTKAITINKETYSFWEKEGSIHASCSRNKNDSPEASAFYPAIKLQNADLTGDWHLEVWNRKYPEPLDMVFRIRDEGDSLISNLIHFQFEGKLYCDKAYGKLDLKQGSFLKMMVYFNESCCTGTQTEFQSHAYDKNILYGEFYNNYGKPTSCAQILWRTNVKATKLPSPFDGSLFVRSNSQANNNETRQTSRKTEKPAKRATEAEGQENASFTALSYKNVENWEAENCKTEIKDNTISITPEKKSKEASIISPVFKPGPRDSYLRVNMDQSKVKSGSIKILVKDVDSGHTEEVYNEDISLSIDEINRQIRDFKLFDETNKNKYNFKSKKINIRKFQNKTIALIITYKASGFTKPPLIIGSID